MHNVRAKLVCTSKKLHPHTMNDKSQATAAHLMFRAVYPNFKDGKCVHDNCPENRIFGEATPSAEFQMYVVNEAAHRYFEEGKEYYVDFTSVESWERVMNAPKALV